MGQPLIAELLHRGHDVKALARQGSDKKLPVACIALMGDALDARTYAQHVPRADTFVHLVGVSHPSPSKAQQFRTIDLVSAREAVAAAVQAGVEHFVYVSVARPAPVMKVYQQVHTECEQIIRSSGSRTLDQELDLQRDEMRRLGFTRDYREGVAAFLEKRPAKFEGR